VCKLKGGGERREKRMEGEGGRERPIGREEGGVGEGFNRGNGRGSSPQHNNE